METFLGNWYTMYVEVCLCHRHAQIVVSVEPHYEKEATEIELCVNRDIWKKIKISKACQERKIQTRILMYIVNF